MIKLKDLLTEAIARGLKPLLQLGSTIKSNVGENALLKLSDKFDRIDDEQADDVASHLNMAIELMQDRSPSEARAWLKKFNTACKDALSGKSIKSAFEGVNRGKLTEDHNQSDVDYAMKMAFDNIPGNWHKALKRVKYSKRSKSIKLNMSSYMGPGQVLQKIVNEFNKSMGTKYKIDKDSFVKGSITSIELREGKK